MKVQCEQETRSLHCWLFFSLSFLLCGLCHSRGNNADILSFLPLAFVIFLHCVDCQSLLNFLSLSDFLSPCLPSCLSGISPCSVEFKYEGIYWHEHIEIQYWQSAMWVSAKKSLPYVLFKAQKMSIFNKTETKKREGPEKNSWIWGYNVSENLLLKLTLT